MSQKRPLCDLPRFLVHGGASNEEDGRSSKLPRVERGENLPAPSPALTLLSLQESAPSHDFHVFPLHIASDDEGNVSQNAFPPFSSYLNSNYSIQNQFSGNGKTLGENVPPQDLVGTQGMVVASVTGTVTVGTFSQRLDDRSVDPQNCTTPSQAESNELEQADLNVFPHTDVLAYPNFFEEQTNGWLEYGDGGNQSFPPQGVQTSNLI